MSWKLVVFVFAVTVMVCAGDGPPAPDDDPAIQHLDILTTGIQICFSKGNAALTGLTSYELEIQDVTTGPNDPIFLKPFTLDVPSADDLKADTICTGCTGCLTEKVRLYLQKKSIKLVLIIQENVFSSTNIEALVPIEIDGATLMPDTLPIPPLTNDIYVIGSDDPRIMKVSDKIEGANKLFLNNNELNLVPACSSTTCYYNGIKIDSEDELNFAICFQKQGTDIPVCGTSKPGVKIDQNGIKPVITIDYDITSDKKASITSGASKTIKDIIYNDMTVCTTPASCKVDFSNEVIIVDYDNSLFDPDTMKDRALDAYELVDGIGTIEVKWKKDTENYFHMTRTITPPSDDDTEYHVANVDCTAVDGPICHAYFVGVAVGNHTIQIQEILDGNWPTPLTVEDDIWKNTTITKDPLSSIAEDFRVIHVEPAVTTFTERSIEMDVCFKYLTNTSMENSHYEFLAVNNKGQWKKTIGEKKKNSSHACFYALELALDDFSENSNFFVLLRDENNGKSLASGKVTFNLPAPKAIKPEMDNSSEGYTRMLAIVGAAIGGVACMVALVAAAILLVMKRKINNDGLQYPLHRTSIENSDIVHGLENPYSTM